MNQQVSSAICHPLPKTIEFIEVGVATRALGVATRAHMLSPCMATQFLNKNLSFHVIYKKRHSDIVTYYIVPLRNPLYMSVWFFMSLHVIPCYPISFLCHLYMLSLSQREIRPHLETQTSCGFRGFRGFCCCCEPTWSEGRSMENWCNIYPLVTGCDGKSPFLLGKSPFLSLNYSRWAIFHSYG